MNIKRILTISAAIIITSSLILCGCTSNSQPAVTSTEPVSAENGVDEYDYHFTLEIIDENGNQTVTDFATNKEILGDVLTEHGIVKGEEGPYGLYIKEVNGSIADYEITGTYWALYINGEMAMTGIDQTEITDGAFYTLKIEK